MGREYSLSAVAVFKCYFLIKRKYSLGSLTVEIQVIYCLVYTVIRWVVIHIIGRFCEICIY